MKGLSITKPSVQVHVLSHILDLITQLGKKCSANLTPPPSLTLSIYLSFFPLFLFSIYSLLPLYVRVYLRTRTFVYVRMYLLSIFILLLLLLFWFYFLWFFAFDSRYYFFHELLFWWRRFCLVIFFLPSPSSPTI